MSESEKSQYVEDEPIQEACGLVALYLPSIDTPHAVRLGLQAATGVQHRGQLGAGIAYPTFEGYRHYVGSGLLRDVFTNQTVSTFTEDNPQGWFLIHTRYGTNGGYNPINFQPAIVHEKGTKNPITIIHNGQFVATDGLREKIQNQTGEAFPEDISDTLLYAHYLAGVDAETMDEKIVRSLDELDGANGAYSLAIGYQDKLYLARDSFGIRPFVLGKLQDGWIATSETRALKKIGSTPEREILRNEILRIDKTGITTLREGLEGQGNFCSFEVSYFGDPTSQSPTFESLDDSYHPERWLSNYEARERAGIAVAKGNTDFQKADYVIGIPDSGVPFAAGVAIGAGIPYRPLIIRDHYDQESDRRLFQGDDDMESIERKVLVKLSLVPGEAFKEKRIILGDDTIVRSKVAKAITKALFAVGAAEVHWAVGFPPVQHTCHLGVSMRTREELIAAMCGGDPIKIAEAIGADSVTFITPHDFIKARKESGEIITPKDVREIFLHNGECGGCITGKYPISADGVIYQRGVS